MPTYREGPFLRAIFALVTGICFFDDWNVFCIKNTPAKYALIG